jgi:hypothetical protein
MYSETQQDARTTKLSTVAPNIRGPSVSNLLHVTLLPPRNLRWRLDFWKICGPLDIYNSPFYNFLKLLRIHIFGKLSLQLTNASSDVREYRMYIYNYCTVLYSTVCLPCSAGLADEIMICTERSLNPGSPKYRETAVIFDTITRSDCAINI